MFVKSSSRQEVGGAALQLVVRFVLKSGGACRERWSRQAGFKTLVWSIVDGIP